MATFFGSSGKNGDFATPDFAYPQKVISDARANLDAGRDHLRCLLEITTAERAIDPDTIFTLPALVEQYIAKAANDADRALLTAYEAEIYATIYSNDRWKYNQVDAPLSPLPDDIAKWSAAQFALKLNELYAKALALAKADNRPLAGYSDDIQFGNEALDYIPDIYSFILSRKIENSTSLADMKFIDKTSLIDDCSAAEGLYPAGSCPAVYWACKKISLTPSRSQKEAYLALYKANEGKPGAPYALAEYVELGDMYDEEVDDDDDDNARAIARRDEQIALFKKVIEQYPTFYRRAIFENRLTALTNPTVKFRVADMAAPGAEITVEAEYAFTKSIGFGLYKLPGADVNYNGYKIASMMPCVAQKKIDTPTTDGNAEVSFTLSEPGVYAIVPMLNGAVQKNANASKILCAPFIPVNVNGCSSNLLITADFTTGAPFAGVQADYMKLGGGANYTKKYLGKTDKNGELSYTAPDHYNTWGNYLQFTYNNQTYKFDQGVRAYSFERNDNPAPQYDANVLTDRNLYHPGDTISWAVAIGERIGDQPARAFAGKKLDVFLFDANNKKIDSLAVTTDALGRAYGSFATTKGSLTGYYRIRVVDADGSRTYTNSSVMVSDFKLPTFEAQFTAVERLADGGVRLSGKATTYSGMPVISAKVALTIEGATRWRWFIPSGTVIANMETTTDAAGAFSIDIPAATLATTTASGEKFDSFQASAVVTSVTAETSVCSKNFTVGKPYVLTASISKTVADSSLPLSVNFFAYNADGDNKPITFSWQLLDSDKNSVLSGSTKGGESEQINVASLAAGEYSLKLIPADATLADTVVMAQKVTLYNLKKNQVPAGNTLFVPETKFTATGKKVEVPVGTSEKEAYVYAIMRCGDDIASQQVRKIGRGFEKFKFDLPDDADKAEVCLFTVRNGVVASCTVELVRPAAKAPEIIAESFRDRLIPGSSETWRFRLVDGDGNGIPEAAIVATMYNKALDQLRTGSFGSLFRLGRRDASLSLSYLGRNQYYYSSAWPFVLSSVPSFSWPDYLFWDTSDLGGSLRIRGYGALKMANATAKVEMAESAEEETSDFVTALQGAMPGLAVSDDTAGAAPEKFDYRLSEVLQAFWRPALLTDADGNVDIVFTVPNANTTWRFRAAAWTSELATANFAADVLANKPVMVQPNLPRFMRQGDKATILATVFNNSADTADVATTVEIFDINTNKVVMSRNFANIIAPSASAVVALDIEAGVDASAIGYRVRLQAGNFADGEQAVIPVLSAASTVIESTEFYLNPTDKDPFTLTVKASDDASVTLQYCQNPVWTVVKAMRGIAGRNESSATGLAGRLFSALAAKYIVEQNPAIAAAIKQWAENPSEEALVSMLEKNEDLKRLLLDQTPWVQAAADNTRRMAALAELLDPAKADAAINATASALAKLQNKDGGFQWGGWMKTSSEWTTATVLTTLGIANSLNMIPASAENVTKMIQPAYSYLETMATQPKRPSTDASLALIATFFPDVDKSVAGSRIIRNTVASVAANWRKHGNSDKAYDILILNANGRKAEAEKVLASLRQFGVVKAGMGLCFPSVSDIRSYATIIQAYAAMGAPASEIDAMRQWVIVQAQANDDLGAYNPDYIIAAVLLTGSKWTDVPVAQNVTVNGKALEIGSMESATGYFSQRLDGKGKLKISVTPNGKTPSYGSVVTIDRRPMNTIEARPGHDLSIDKRVLVEHDGNWVETDDFALGERVRVQLTIVAKRNLEYISIDDERPACFEPVDQLPGYVYDGGLGFYRENLDASTRLFIGYLPQGTYHVTYDMTAALAGSFISGIATLQSQYAAELTAHSGAARISVK